MNQNNFDDKDLFRYANNLEDIFFGFYNSSYITQGGAPFIHG